MNNEQFVFPITIECPICHTNGDDHRVTENKNGWGIIECAACANNFGDPGEFRKRLETLRLAFNDAEQRIATNPNDENYVDMQRKKQVEWVNESSAVVSILIEFEERQKL